MILAYDKRSELKGQPGLHAFIVGISHYRHLPGGSGPPASFVGLAQLSTAARSAYGLYRWLLDRARPPVPLATIRLLLSPSPEEASAEPALAKLQGPCRLDEFLTAAYDWRSDADTHPNGYTFFYFSGNGVLVNKTDTVLLLEDFGDPRGGILRNAVSTRNLIAGMARSRARTTNTAKTQLYFIDSSRDTPESLMRSLSTQPSPVFDIEVPRGPDDRVATCFYATSPSARAYARAGKQSLFSDELIRCLEGAAATPMEESDEASSEEVSQIRWGVTVNSLSAALSQRMQVLTENLGITQMVRVDILGQGSDAVITYLDDEPQTSFELSIDPPEAHEFASVTITDTREKVVLDLPAPLNPHPVNATIPAGFYFVDVSFDPSSPYRSWRTFRAILPPGTKIKIKVS